MKEDIIVPTRSLDPAGAFGLRLAGSSFCDGQYRIAREARDDIFVIEYVEEGEGYLCVEDRMYYPKAGDVYFAPAFVRHHYGSSADRPWTKHWFNISGSLFPAQLDACGLSGVHHIPACPVGSLFKEALERLRENTNENMAPDILRIVMVVADCHYRRDSSDSSPSRDGALLKHFIEKNVMKRSLSLDDMSRSIHKSNAQTIRVCKRDFGVSPYQFFLNKKMEKACDLLIHSKLTVKEIAHMTGFADEFYFSNIFKKKKNVAPTYYRQMRTSI